MKTPICATCGCSFIRLGIAKKNIIKGTYSGKEWLFCCQGCFDIFLEEPEKYIDETSQVIVCPTCLGEKHKSVAIEYQYESKTIHFCRCPFCLEEFNKKPQYYIDRLMGMTEFKGLFHGQNTCCGESPTR